MTTNPLTWREVEPIAQIFRAAEGNQKVSIVEEFDGVSVGTARHVVRDAETAGFLGPNDDVRDGFLRVTMRSGWERFLPMRELIERVLAGTVVLDYDAEAGECEICGASMVRPGGGAGHKHQAATTTTTTKENQ